MADPEEIWLPLVDEPVGNIVAQIQAEDPEIDKLVGSRHRILAFRTFAYIRVGLLLGELLFEQERTPEDADDNWVEALLRDPKHHEALHREVYDLRKGDLGAGHRKTLQSRTGIARTLGEPWVSATPVAESPSEVELTVAWELSWYRYRVDLGDAEDPVTLRDKGEELDQLEESARDWNASSLPDGTILIGVRSEQ